MALCFMDLRHTSKKCDSPYLIAKIRSSNLDCGIRAFELQNHFEMRCDQMIEIVQNIPTFPPAYLLRAITIGK